MESKQQFQAYELAKRQKIISLHIQIEREKAEKQKYFFNKMLLSFKTNLAEQTICKYCLTCTCKSPFLILMNNSVLVDITIDMKFHINYSLNKQQIQDGFNHSNLFLAASDY